MSLTEAETMIEVAEAMLLPKKNIISLEELADYGELNEFAEYLVLCIRLYRAPTPLKFKAIYEEWDRTRIVRELY